MDDVFKALADPGRRRLLDSLNARNGQSLGELCSELDMARQSVSKHLGVLEGAGLVTHEKHGREVLYALEPRRLDDAREFLNGISAGWDRAIERLRKMVE